MPDVTLCADTESIQHPEMIGLEGENLGAQTWLAVCTTGAHARSLVGQGAAKEVWVAGSDDVESINLAAALKHDGTTAKICLLAPHPSGSLSSRAQAAGIDEVLDQAAFASRYQACKRFSTQGSAASSHATPVRCKPALQTLTSQKSKGYVLAVVGAGGGVGKSSVSMMLACAAQHLGLETVIVDADLQFGDIHHLAGVQDPLTLDAAVAAPVRLDALTAEGRMPAVLAAPAHLEQSEVVFSQLSSIVDRLAQRFDVVVVNTSTWYNDAQIKLMEQANNVLFVLGQRPSSVWACRHALDLCARCGVAAQPFLFALNRCSRQALFSSIDMSCALKGVHVDELQEGGREVDELLGAGQPLDLLDSKNSFSASIMRLAQDILPKAASTSPATIKMPPSRRKGRFALRRKKAACL